jgi:hypothetical protein
MKKLSIDQPNLSLELPGNSVTLHQNKDGPIAAGCGLKQVIIKNMTAASSNPLEVTN